jgi:hypothetical protein
VETNGVPISELTDAPQWLKDARTADARVGIDTYGRVVWHTGVWLDGEWHRGYWRGGVWHGGVWRGGVWDSGIWLDGVWLDGVWRGGEWDSGEWRGKENRVLYMASMLGITFQNGQAIAYRTTQSDGRGRHTDGFIQVEGEYFETNLPPAGSGTWVKGIHVTSAPIAWYYFGVDPACQFWRVRFKQEDLLDCDGQKCRIRGGVFEKMERPF